MSRTRIKFCGMTRVEDALAAAEAGADAIGMVLYANSPRRIARDLARQIVAALPAFVTPVGLFVDAPPLFVAECAAELGLRQVQLHGKEPPSAVAALRGLSIIKAIRVTRDGLAAALEPWRGVLQLKGMLLETGTTAQAGGSGVENDWEAILQVQRAGGFAGLPPIIAAGGLRPDNVARVIAMLRPWAVDVSSGIESAPGIKSREKMAAFMQAVL
jgi:phosphoribosylanthranilate isomerase